MQEAETKHCAVGVSIATAVTSIASRLPGSLFSGHILYFQLMHFKPIPDPWSAYVLRQFLIPFLLFANGSPDLVCCAKPLRAAHISNSSDGPEYG